MTKVEHLMVGLKKEKVVKPKVEAKKTGMKRI